MTTEDYRRIADDMKFPGFVVTVIEISPIDATSRNHQTKREMWDFLCEYYPVCS
jgi:hypothetical protein